MYLAIKQTAWYMEISVYFAMKHMARYMEISMYLSDGYTNKAYMKRSVYVTHKQAFPYSHCIINKLVAEVFIMRCNSPVSAHAYCGVDALRSWSIYLSPCLKGTPGRRPAFASVPCTVSRPQHRWQNIVFPLHRLPSLLQSRSTLPLSHRQLWKNRLLLIRFSHRPRLQF